MQKKQRPYIVEYGFTNCEDSEEFRELAYFTPSERETTVLCCVFTVYVSLSYGFNIYKHWIRHTTERVLSQPERHTWEVEREREHGWLSCS